MKKKMSSFSLGLLQVGASQYFLYFSSRSSVGGPTMTVAEGLRYFLRKFCIVSFYTIFIGD